jgi:hypothetical protein
MISVHAEERGGMAQGPPLASLSHTRTTHSREACGKPTRGPLLSYFAVTHAG